MSLRKFDTLTDRGKRLRIARDVIVQLKSGKIKAQDGIYLDMIAKNPVDDTDSVREVIKQSECTACAIGSLFVCAVRAKNGLTLADVNAIIDDRRDGADVEISDYHMRDRLEKYFSKEQLSLIESAFEKSEMGDVEDSDSHERAIHFNAKVYDNKKGMIRIMENIIKNNGTFIP